MENNKKSLLAIVILILVAAGIIFYFAKIKPGNEEQEVLPKVTTSFYPLAFLVKEIAGDKVEIINFTGEKDVHAYSPSDEELKKLEDSQMIVINGSGLEKWENETSVFNANGKRVVIASDLVTKIKNGDVTDPHTWLNPADMRIMAQNVFQGLIEEFPNHKVYFEENLETLVSRIEGLQNLYEVSLKNCTTDTVKVSHDAYKYLAKDFGFKTELVEESSVELNSLETLSSDRISKGENYLTEMEVNLTKLIEALGCSAGAKL